MRRSAAAAAAKPVSASSVSPVSRANRTAGTPRPAPARSRLALVPPMTADAPRAPFVMLVAGLLVAGLVGLLFLHTQLAEDSFRLHDLQVRAAVLDDKEQALEQRIAFLAAPSRLAAQAHALGMVRSENPAFIRLSDGRILGKPKAGVAPPPVVPTAVPSGGPSDRPSDAASPQPSPSGSAD
jgi:hypothetical protein